MRVLQFTAQKAADIIRDAAEKARRRGRGAEAVREAAIEEDKPGTDWEVEPREIYGRATKNERVLEFGRAAGRQGARWFAGGEYDGNAKLLHKCLVGVPSESNCRGPRHHAL